jgi:aminoglycoside phosphotransferase (APT) family kinase protein
LRTRPPAEVQIDVALVRRLIAAQFPQWAGLAVPPVESAGWDNTIYRLGADLAAGLAEYTSRLIETGLGKDWLGIPDDNPDRGA